MIAKWNVVLATIVTVGIVNAQTPPPVPDPNAGLPPIEAPPALPTDPIAQPPTAGPGVEELLDASGLVINKNTFIYDGNEGRDPFKVYREYTIPIGQSENGHPGDVKNSATAGVSEKNIRTVVVPEDIVVQGILYRKKDPIALVMIKGVKGLNKLKVNSAVGRNEGKVIEIRQDRIVIEQVKDFDGQKFTEKITLEVRARKIN